MTELDFDWMKPMVLVTGFGPFEKNPVNASWEAVKLLPHDEIEKRHNIELVTIEIPVTYENVDEFVPQLWDTHTPKLMMHVGVSKEAKELTVEQVAHRKGYKRPDYLAHCPANQCATADGASRLSTGLDVRSLLDNYPQHPLALSDNLTITSSINAGRYLCEYIYYTSLSIDARRTVFVHVPKIDVWPPERTARALTALLDLVLAQIDAREHAATTPAPAIMQRGQGDADYEKLDENRL